jgi:hypothetical protein
MSRMQAEVHPSKKEKEKKTAAKRRKDRPRTHARSSRFVRSSPGAWTELRRRPRKAREKRETRGPARGRALGSRDSREPGRPGQNMNVAFTFKNPMVELYLPSALGEREGTLLVA